MEWLLIIILSKYNHALQYHTERFPSKEVCLKVAKATEDIIPMNGYKEMSFNSKVTYKPSLRYKFKCVEVPKK